MLNLQGILKSTLQLGNHLSSVFKSMFVERQVCYSALFTYLVGWHASAVSLPPSDDILVQLAFPLSDIIFCLYSGLTDPSVYKHCQVQSLHKKMFNNVFFISTLGRTQCQLVSYNLNFKLDCFVTYKTKTKQHQANRQTNVGRSQYFICPWQGRNTNIG